jgi:hypothetical protein
MQPEFNLALIGFTAEQRILMQAQLLANKSETKAERADDCPAWRISDYSEANALLFNANLIANSAFPPKFVARCHHGAATE